MLQVSSKTEYGMRCLRLMALEGTDKALSITDIARREHVPKPYAQQIMMQLRRAGLVKSLRGTQGGFTLAKPADQISVGDILRVLENQATANACDTFNKKTECGHMGDCSIRPVWETIAQRLWNSLDKISLKHLITDEKTVSQRLVLELPVLNNPVDSGHSCHHNT